MNINCKSYADLWRRRRKRVDGFTLDFRNTYIFS
jgi:hypothetical protein